MYNRVTLQHWENYYLQTKITRLPETLGHMAIDHWHDQNNVPSEDVKCKTVDKQSNHDDYKSTQKYV